MYSKILIILQPSTRRPQLPSVHPPIHPVPIHFMLSTNSSVIVAIRMVSKVLNWCDTLSGLQVSKHGSSLECQSKGCSLTHACSLHGTLSFEIQILRPNDSILVAATHCKWKRCTELNKPQRHTHHDACCSLTLLVVQSTSDSSLTAVTMQHREVCSQDTSTQCSEIKTSMFFTHISLHHVDINKQIHSTSDSLHLVMHMSPHHSLCLHSNQPPFTQSLTLICSTDPFPHSLQVPLGLTFHRAPSSKKWNFRTQFLENFRTILLVSRGSRHRKS